MANRINVVRVALNTESVLPRGLVALLFTCVGLLTPPQVLCAGASKIAFELTGTVLDTNTKQPIEGAYVVASYREVVVGEAVATSWCVKTKGMYTEKDGRFHFPVEKLDGYSPFIVSAVRSGYHRGPAEPVKREVWRKQNAASYSGRVVYLTAQNPASPDFHFGEGDEFCNRAPTKEAAAAGVEFLKITLQERIKYKAPQQNIDGNREVIEILESLPSQGETNKMRRP